MMNLDLKHLINVLKKEISCQSIISLVSNITQFHRIQGSKTYLGAAQYIRSILDENGIENTLFNFPADGKWEAWGWTAPISWDISFGELWLIRPVKKRLCSFRDTPMSVITHSKAADFEASLVDVGAGEQEDDYEIATGKIAMITAAPRRVFSLAAKHAVKGLILYPSLERGANIGPTAVQYDGFWPSHHNLGDVTSGFSISLRQAIELKQMIKTNEDVRVKLRIDAEFYEGQIHVLEAEIKGSERPNEEIILISHLCHPAPSANDNASGSATLVELLLSLKRMITTGEILPPKRTLKFLWVPEFSGTIPWLKQSEEQLKNTDKKILAALNLDMVGESPAKIGTPLRISQPSYSSPSYLEALLKIITEQVANLDAEYNTDGRVYQLNFRFAPFAGGSDHLIFNDQYFCIPSIMLGHDDLYHHSSADSLDKVDPLECRSVALIAGTVAYGLAITDTQFLNDLALLVLKEAIEKAINTGLQNGLSSSQKIKLAKLHENLALKRLESVIELDFENTLQDKLNDLQQIVKNQFSGVQRLIAVDDKHDSQESLPQGKIKRSYDHPTSLKILRKPDRTIEEQKRLVGLLKDHWGAIPLELLNLANGTYSSEEIFLLLKSQYPNLTLEDVIFMIKLFQKEGILTS